MKSTNSNERSLIIKAALFIIGTLLFALALNVALSTLTLEKIYTNSLLSEYRVIGRYYERQIERSLSFGKILSKFTGMSKLLEDIGSENPGISQIFIHSQSREPLFSLNQTIPTSGSALVKAESLPNDMLREKGNCHLIFPLMGPPIADPSPNIQGYMEIILPESLIREKVRELIINTVRLLVEVSVVSTLVFLAIGFFYLPAPKKQHIFTFSLKTRVLLMTSLVLILSQVVFSFFNVSEFQERYFNTVRGKSEILGKVLITDINHFLRIGIPINKLVKIDQLLNDILKFTPELRSIKIIDTTGKTLYNVQAKDSWGKEQGSGSRDLDETASSLEKGYQVQLPVTDKMDQTVGFIQMHISHQVIYAKIRDLVLDSATIVVVSLLIGFEFVFFLVAYLCGDNRGTNGSASLSEDSHDKDAFIPVRTTAFLYAFAMALSMSFLPIYANELYASFPGVKREIAIGLPISAEMFFVALSLAAAGIWLNRKSWFSLFLTGAVITGIGVGMCGSARSIMDLILFRCCVGLGYGLVVMSTQFLVIQLTSSEKRSSAIAALEAGYFSGFISSTAVGGMLADRIGFRSVFYLGSLLTILSIVFVLLFLRDLRKVGRTSSPEPGESHISISSLMLFKDKQFLGTLVLSAIPSAICLVGFLYFASPLFLTKAGVSQSSIARLMMPYGLCMVFLAPLLNKWVDTIKDKKIPIVAGGILGGAALLSFYFLNSIFMFVVILVLFSLSGGISYAARISYICEAQISKSGGVSKSLGIFNSIERMGNISGPILVGAIIGTVGVTTAISSVGLLYLVSTILFMLTAHRPSKLALQPGKTE
ncbi:MAG: MFS transporter [Pseudomonadota bacterium]